MTIMVMDGQGGRMGKSVVEQIRKRFPEDEILAIGTNSIATAAMLKAGADAGATGENPAIVGSRRADIIIGAHGHRHRRFPDGGDHAGQAVARARARRKRC